MNEGERPLGMVEDLFTYAFRGSGKYILALGAGLFVVADLVSFAPIIGWIAGWILFAYFCAVYFEVILTTATGGNEAPDFPETANLMDDLLAPMLKVMFVLLVCFGPAIFFGIFAGEDADPLLLGGLLVIGTVYFPMAMMAVAVLGYVGALSPHIVLPAIFRAGGLYWLAVFVICLIYLALGFVEAFFGGIPILGTLVLAILGMYVMLTNGRMLGIIYRERREEMNWI